MEIIDRDKARTWSKGRIREELADLRREISEYYEEIRDLEDDIDEEMAGISSGASPRARSSDPYKHTDAMGDAVARDYNIIAQMESDLEFLKSLLDDTEGKKAEIKILQSVYQKPPETPILVQRFTQPIPRGRPGVGGDTPEMPLLAKLLVLIGALGAIGILMIGIAKELGRISF